MKRANHQRKPANQMLQDLPVEQRMRIAQTESADILIQLVHDREESVILDILENPNVTEKIILAICRRRVISSRVLETISRNRKWVQHYQIRYELVRNPRTPVYVSLRFVKTLYRQEMSNLVRDVSVPASIRANAEAALKERIKDLTLGDKIALAHSATAPILRLLLMEGNPQVIESALSNSRLNENDVLYMLNTTEVDEEVLSVISSNKRWANRYDIKMAIACNPKISPDSLEKLLITCLQQDLQDIIDTPSFPLDVRMAAKKVMKTRIDGLSRPEKILMAQKGKKDVLSVMVYEEDENILSTLLKNPNIKDEHVVTITHKTRDPHTLADIARNEKWRENPMIALALYNNPQSPDFIKMHLKDTIDDSTEE